MSLTYKLFLYSVFFFFFSLVSSLFFSALEIGIPSYIIYCLYFFFFSYSLHASFLSKISLNHGNISIYIPSSLTIATCFRLQTFDTNYSLALPLFLILLLPSPYFFSPIWRFFFSLPDQLFHKSEKDTDILLCILLFSPSKHHHFRLIYIQV